MKRQEEIRDESKTGAGIETRGDSGERKSQLSRSFDVCRLGISQGPPDLSAR
jgi:hypothetical protein